MALPRLNISMVLNCSSAICFRSLTVLPFDCLRGQMFFVCCATQELSLLSDYYCYTSQRPFRFCLDEFPSNATTLFNLAWDWPPLDTPSGFECPARETVHCLCIHCNVWLIDLIWPIKEKETAVMAVAIFLTKLGVSLLCLDCQFITCLTFLPTLKQ